MDLVKYDIFGNDFKLHAKTFFTKSNKICASYLQKFEKNSLLSFARICNESRFLPSKKEAFSSFQTCQLWEHRGDPFFKLISLEEFLHLKSKILKQKNNTANGSK